jgi:hypothetical protein
MKSIVRMTISVDEYTASRSPSSQDRASTRSIAQARLDARRLLVDLIAVNVSGVE